MLEKFTNLFWLWTILGVTWAWFLPPHFAWFGPWVSPGLGVIMLGMGLTLSFEDFRKVLQQPQAIGIGVFAQFLIMPAIGYSIAKMFGLPPSLAAGLVLVSCCPGGTASNVIAFLAKANVALSVLMTMCSTGLAIVLTPLMTGWLAGEFVEVDVMKLLMTTVLVVLLPVIFGLLLNQFAGKWVRPLRSISPLVSVVFIVLIVGFVISANRQKILESGWLLLGAVWLMHLTGFTCGYLFAWLMGYPEDFRRTVCIEVGMQNSGLGATLAKSFPDPVVAVPSALSALAHCLIGSFLAAIWSRRGTTLEREQA